MFLRCSTKKSHTQIDKAVWQQISYVLVSPKGCSLSHRGFPPGASLVARGYHYLKAARETHMPLGAPKDRARFWVRPFFCWPSVLSHYGGAIGAQRRFLFGEPFRGLALAGGSLSDTSRSRLALNALLTRLASSTLFWKRLRIRSKFAFPMVFNLEWE
jgi:hypothetical protein